MHLLFTNYKIVDIRITKAIKMSTEIVTKWKIIQLNTISIIESAAFFCCLCGCGCGGGLVMVGSTIYSSSGNRLFESHRRHMGHWALNLHTIALGLLSLATIWVGSAVATADTCLGSLAPSYGTRSISWCQSEGCWNVQLINLQSTGHWSWVSFVCLLVASLCHGIWSHRIRNHSVQVNAISLLLIEMELLISLNTLLCIYRISIARQTSYHLHIKIFDDRYYDF